METGTAQGRPGVWVAWRRHPDRTAGPGVPQRALLVLWNLSRKNLRMPTIEPVRRDQYYEAFMEAFSDYAMDASGVQEERLLLRMEKNKVDYDISPGLYDGNRLVGFTVIGIDAWEGMLTAYDCATGLAANYRKLGWARKLFDHALPALRQRGVGRFVLEVLQQNEPAIKAYEKSGFEIARELKCLSSDVETLVALPPSGGIDVRPATREEARSLEAAASFAPCFENRFSTLDAIPEQVCIDGAFIGGQLAGVSAYSPALNWLLTLLVSPDHRRKGVGTALLKNISTHLPEGTSKLAALDIDGEEDGMLAFFGSCGFEPLVDQYEMTREI